MAKRFIGAREANQHFSALIKAVEEEDVTVIITRRGEPVVQIQRVAPEQDAEGTAARMQALFEKYSRPMNVHGGIDREEIHDRELERKKCNEIVLPREKE